MALLTGLILGLLLGLVLSPVLRSWMAWREYVEARRQAGAADRVIRRLEADFERRRPGREAAGAHRDR